MLFYAYLQLVECWYQKYIGGRLNMSVRSVADPEFWNKEAEGQGGGKAWGRGCALSSRTFLKFNA